jgi:hypothetical protein
LEVFTQTTASVLAAPAQLLPPNDRLHRAFPVVVSNAPEYTVEKAPHLISDGGRRAHQ